MNGNLQAGEDIHAAVTADIHEGESGLHPDVSQDGFRVLLLSALLIVSGAGVTFVSAQNKLTNTNALILVALLIFPSYEMRYSMHQQFERLY